MLDIFNTPTPLNCNFQEFYYQGSATTGRNARWVKPRGCSMVRFLLIGGAGGGSANATSGGAGGGSGAMTSLVIPALFVPNSILVQVGAGGNGAGGTATSGAGSPGNDTFLLGVFTSSTPVTLLTAQNGGGGSASGTGGSGGTTETGNFFSAAGIYESIAGQAGAASNTNLVASSTIPLTGGAGGRTTANPRSVTPNYGYPEADTGSSTKAGNGYFQLSPILIGCGGAGGGNTHAGGDGGIGCGGGGGGANGTTTGLAGGKGGNGAVFIWAW